MSGNGNGRKGQDCVAVNQFYTFGQDCKFKIWPVIISVVQLL